MHTYVERVEQGFICPGDVAAHTRRGTTCEGATKVSVANNNVPVPLSRDRMPLVLYLFRA